MDATNLLSSEHRVIERMIDALEAAAGELERGGRVDPRLFLSASDFIRGFADGCHHRKEEGILFPALARNGFPAETWPVAVMLAEHEQGRVYNRDLRAAAERYQTGDSSAAQSIAASAREYGALLRQHIQKEEQVLFKLADAVIPAKQQPGILDGLEKLEQAETGEGIHEKYLALAEWLESQAAAFAPANAR